jgi:hypothetical protein
MAFASNHTEALFQSLIGKMEETFNVGGPDAKNFKDLGDWCVKTNVMLDGKPFSFLKHEYLREPYSDTHNFQVEIKATQLGLTSKALLRVVYGCRYGLYRGIMYFFPSRTDVTEMSKSRLTPLIEDNPDTVGQWIKDTDSANVKKIWNSFLYLRGMQSRVGMKSVPSDMNVYDELDEAPQKSVDMANERMGHSEIGDLLFLSNPTLPDYGIDALFQTTDQRFWLLKCPKCNHFTDLVSTFPKTLIRVKGKTIRACEKCQAELDPEVGLWVAKRPEILERRGRQFSQLYSMSRNSSPENILRQFETTKNMPDFYNLKVGIAYVDAKDRLTQEQILDCCGQNSMVSQSSSGTYMGVDQNNNFHVVIGKKTDKGGEIVHIGEYKGNVDKTGEGWKFLDELMTRFKVMRCVVDYLPETKHARAFAERFPGRVFLNFYNKHQKGNYNWNEGTMMVQVNRTESLDASHKEIVDHTIVLPRENEVVQEFAKQCHNVAKKLVTDEETGSQYYEYMRLGPDHYRHAFNYECMARQDAPELMFPELL